jgi:hypothetical protein
MGGADSSLPRRYLSTLNCTQRISTKLSVGGTCRTASDYVQLEVSLVS